MSAQTPFAPAEDSAAADRPGFDAPPNSGYEPIEEPGISFDYGGGHGESQVLPASDGEDDVPPMLARIIGGIGRLFITVGVLLLLFAGFQLWGTGLAEARAQDDLSKRFADRLAAQTGPDATVGPTMPSVHFTAGPIFDLDPTLAEPRIEGSAEIVRAAPLVPELASPDPGEPIGVIEIPAIGVEKTIVEGTTRDALRSGPGHYRSTPLPGRTGNTAIAGHRTTHGAPFFDLDLLEPGDEIQVETLEGTATYLVEAHDDGTGGQVGHMIVDPSDVGVIADQGDNRLTLTACHPKYSAKERIIVTATLVTAANISTIIEQRASATPAEAPAAVALEDTATAVDAAAVLDEMDPDQMVQNEATPIAAERHETEEDGETYADGDTIAASLGWQPQFLPQTLLWAAITGLIAVAGWLVGRFWRRWPAYAMTVPPVSLALFYCFANLEKFIPAV